MKRYKSDIIQYLDQLEEVESGHLPQRYLGEDGPLRLFGDMCDTDFSSIDQFLPYTYGFEEDYMKDFLFHLKRVVEEEFDRGTVNAYLDAADEIRQFVNSHPEEFGFKV